MNFPLHSEFSWVIVPHPILTLINGSTPSLATNDDDNDNFWDWIFNYSHVTMERAPYIACSELIPICLASQPLLLLPLPRAFATSGHKNILRRSEAEVIILHCGHNFFAPCRTKKEAIWRQSSCGEIPIAINTGYKLHLWEKLTKVRSQQASQWTCQHDMETTGFLYLSWSSEWWQKKISMDELHWLSVDLQSSCRCIAEYFYLSRGQNVPCI